MHDGCAPSPSPRHNPLAPPHRRMAALENGRAPTTRAFPPAAPSSPGATVPTPASAAPDRPDQPPAPSPARTALAAGSSENDQSARSAQFDRSTRETESPRETFAGAAEFAKTLPAQGPR